MKIFYLHYENDMTGHTDRMTFTSIHEAEQMADTLESMGITTNYAINEMEDNGVDILMTVNGHTRVFANLSFAVAYAEVIFNHVYDADEDEIFAISTSIGRFSMESNTTVDIAYLAWKTIDEITNGDIEFPAITLEDVLGYTDAWLEFAGDHSTEDY